MMSTLNIVSFSEADLDKDCRERRIRIARIRGTAYVCSPPPRQCRSSMEVSTDERRIQVFALPCAG